MQKCALLKKAKKIIAKKLKVIFSGTVEKNYIFFAHDTIQ